MDNKRRKKDQDQGYGDKPHTEQNCTDSIEMQCLNEARSRITTVFIDKFEAELAKCDDLQKECYQCGKPVKWLAPDSRCGCARITPEEIRGE